MRARLSTAVTRLAHTHVRCFHAATPRLAVALPRHIPPIKVPHKTFTRAEVEQLVKDVKQQPEMPRTNLPILSIGAGNIVQVAHYPAYREVGFTVSGVTDINLDTAKQTAREWNVPHVYDSVQSMVAANKDKRVVYDIAVPATAIAAVLSQLPNNSYALIQKPMGENIGDAKEIVRICESKNIAGAINFQLRSAAYIIAMKNLIASGVIGEITGIDFYTNVYTPWKKWTFMEQASRMEIIYHSIHYTDCMRDLYGDPSHLHAMTWKHVDTPKLHSVRSNLLFIYDEAVQTTIHTNHNHRWDVQHRHAESYIKIEGTQGFMKAMMGGNIEYPRSDLDYLHLGCDATNGELIDIPLQGSWFPNAFKGPMANVMRFAEGSIERIPTSVQDSYKTMAVCEAAYQSAANPTPIRYH